MKRQCALWIGTIWLIVVMIRFPENCNLVQAQKEIDGMKKNRLQNEEISEKQADYVTAQQERPESSSIEEYQDTMTPHFLHQRTFIVEPFVPLATPCESGQVMSTLSEQKSKHESLEKDKISSAYFYKNDDIVSRAFPNEDKMSDNEISSMHQVNKEADYLEQLVNTFEPTKPNSQNDDFRTGTSVVVDILTGSQKTGYEDSNVGSFHAADLWQYEKEVEEPSKESSSARRDISEPTVGEDKLHFSKKLSSNETNSSNPLIANEGDVNSLSKGSVQRIGHEDYSPLETMDAGNVPENVINVQGNENPSSDGSTKDDIEVLQSKNEHARDDMPSFNEWSQKFLAQEEEKKVAHINDKGTAEDGSQPKKKNIDRKQNNYASVDCGAIISETNPEAQNSHSVLLENKDLYMLNPCSAKIWFVVELCDHILVTSLQLANFEMFSSTISKFQVSFSTRYPTREWKKLQVFDAKPEKSIQTFALDPIFAKYIKIEQLSYHGSEHYCPWSLLRVFGNSMVEEYVELESAPEDGHGLDVDATQSSNLTGSRGKQSEGILKSATDAVLKFVTETAKKLVHAKEESNSTHNCTNASNYTKDNCNEHVQSKTIVELIPRERYESSCREDDGNRKICVFSKMCCFCGRSCYSYSSFLDIFFKMSVRLFKGQNCYFEAVRKTRIGNFSGNERLHLASIRKLRNFVDGVAISNTSLMNATNETSIEEKASNVSLMSKGAEINGANGENNKVLRVNSSIINDDGTSKMDIYFERSSSSDSSTILDNSPSTKNTAKSAMANSDIYEQTVSSVTPLAQPPLAEIKKRHSIDEFPKQKSSSQSFHKINPSKTNESDINLFERSIPFSSSRAEYRASVSITQPEVHANLEIQNSVNVGIFDGSDVFDKNGQALALSVSEKEQNVDHGRLEIMSKDEGEVHNSHVDVLKITLTDAETKEGTAEPESVILQGGGKEKENNIVDLKNTEGKKLEAKFSVSESPYQEKKTSGAAFATDEEKSPVGSSLSYVNDYDHMIHSKHWKMTEKEISTSEQATIENGHGHETRESIFVMLSRKIRALEQNVTMTNLFLEELSQRYRKSLDEMQKKVEKRLNAFSKDYQFLTEVNSSQNFTIYTLASKIKYLEEKLNDVTSRLNVMNEEVMERHLLVVCFHLFIVFVLWLFVRFIWTNWWPYVFRQYPKSPVVVLGSDYTQQKGTKRDAKHECSEQISNKIKSSTIKAEFTETKRRKRRKHRNAPAPKENAFENSSSVYGNIVSPSAGLLFNTQPSDEASSATSLVQETLRCSSAHSL